MTNVVFADEVGVVDVTQFPGDPIGPIFMDDISCNGEEETLLDCGFTLLQMCSHTHDVGVICHRKSILTNTEGSVTPFHFAAASECEINNAGCDHYCTETIESYTCSCYVGYTLDLDGHTCVGKQTFFTTLCITIINLEVLSFMVCSVVSEK